MEPMEMDNISKLSKETTIIPKKRSTTTRNNVSVTIEVITKLDKESIQKLQRQRETLQLLDLDLGSTLVK